MRGKKARGIKPRTAKSSAFAEDARVALYNHVRSPLMIRTGADDTNLRGDPFLAAAKVQYIHKCDYTLETYTVGQCTPLSSYSSGKSDHVHRAHWAPPVIVKQADNGSRIGAIEGDQRGVFADIGVTKIAFKNVMKQPLKIIINSPRGRISDPGQCYLRRYKREIEIQPGKTRWYTAGWGDKANIFTPMSCVIDTTEQAPKNRLETFVIVDYTIVIPDVDEMSGANVSNLGAQSAVEVRFQQRYIATAAYTSYGRTGSDEIKYISRKPLLVSKLGGLSDMMYESPIALSGALPFHVGVGSVAGRRVLQSSGNALSMPEYEGRLLVLHGVVGYWKVVDSNLVHWDVDTDQPHDSTLEPIVVAPGCPWQVLPSELTVGIRDIISWLTTVTEILTVVGAFL